MSTNQREELIIDSAAMVEDFKRVAAGLTSERHRAMMDVLIRHADAELINHDIDVLMATMIPQPRFRYYGTVGMPNFTGYEATREYYLGVLQIPKNASAMQMESLTIGDDAVVMEGFVLMAPGWLHNSSEDMELVIDPDRPAVIRKRLCVIFPFEDGLMTGEVHYFDGPFGPGDLVYLDE